MSGIITFFITKVLKKEVNSKVVHTIDRAIIHVFSAPMLWLLLYVFMARPLANHDLELTAKILAAITAFAIIAPREIKDVERDGLKKSVIDYISWIVGLTATMFLVRGL